MLPVGFEPTISAGKQPLTYALDRAATGTGAVYRSADESLARPGRKQATATKL